MSNSITGPLGPAPGSSIDPVGRTTPGLHVPSTGAHTGPRASGTGGGDIFIQGAITIKVDGTGRNGEQQIGGEIVGALQRRAMATRGVTTSFHEAN